MSTVVWEELVASALLGTERRPPVAPAAGEDALARSLGALPWEDAEGALLGAAGLLAGYRAAGWQPPVLEDAPSPAPADERPLCSPGAAALLARLLESGPTLLLAEWLRLARTAGVSPTPELLPALLDAGADRTWLRAPLLDARVARLRWLAEQNARWSWAAGGAAHDAGIDERWRTGTRDERLALLRALRSEDPQRGRELLAATWSADGAQDRAQLLAVLEIGLQASDEQFLEAALDDRSKAVRRQAAQLLAGLPGSALARRMAQRLRPLVATGGRLRRRLVLETPPEPDDAARRDGIDAGGRPQDLGPGAWRLAQIVGASPLSVWHEVTGEDAAAATLALARGADHEPALLFGWTTAARRQRDPHWAAVLAQAIGDPELLGTLALGTGDDVALALLGQTTGTPALNALLVRIPAPWSARLSRAVIDHVARILVGSDAPWSLRLDPAALALDLSVRAHAAAALEPVLQRDDLHPTVRDQLAGLLSNLDLRYAMTRELTQP